MSERSSTTVPRLTLSGASESVRVTPTRFGMLPSAALRRITESGTPDRPGTEWKRNFANPRSELPAQTPVPTHRYKPREVRRQGYPRESRSPSRRVVVKLGSWSACADGAPQSCGAPSSCPTTGSRVPRPGVHRRPDRRGPDAMRRISRTQTCRGRRSRQHCHQLEPLQIAMSAGSPRYDRAASHSKAALSRRTSRGTFRGDDGMESKPSIRQDDPVANSQNHPNSRRCVERLFIDNSTTERYRKSLYAFA